MRMWRVPEVQVPSLLIVESENGNIFLVESNEIGESSIEKILKSNDKKSTRRKLNEPEIFFQHEPIDHSETSILTPK
jgi:hypothetical protein